MSESDPHDLGAGGVFRSLQPQPPDALLSLIGLHRADTRPDKIDLGVGVYRDDTGATPVMRAVKAAEAKLLSTQSSKSYLGAEGDAHYTALLAALVFGQTRAEDGRLTGVQTPGGTGALRLGAELLARAAPNATVWVGTPTWPNHVPMFRQADLQVRTHSFFDSQTSTIDFDAMSAELRQARPGDVLLLHGCCHNPTGAAFTPDQWRAVANFCSTNGIVPFIDLAYQGLGEGVAADAFGARLLLDFVPDGLIAYSCDKNFALYRERVGALWVQTGSAGTISVVRDNMLVLARMLWSMPPDHGAAIVRVILDDPQLQADWQGELTAMRARLQYLRHQLAASHPRLEPIAAQQGLFAMLPIDSQAVRALRENHGVYMADSARINIAGLNEESLPRFADMLGRFLSGPVAGAKG